MIKLHFLNYLFAFVIPFCSQKIEKERITSSESVLNADQNLSTEECALPLKGFQSFAVFAYLKYPEPKPECIQETNALLVKELKKIGNVKKVDLGKKALPFEVVEGFSSDAVLYFLSDDLNSIEKESILASQFSLNLLTSVMMKKSNRICQAQVWGKNCFVKDVSGKNFKDKTLKSFRFLIEDFMKQYTFSNPDQKPTFYFFGS